MDPYDRDQQGKSPEHDHDDHDDWNDTPQDHEDDWTGDADLTEDSHNTDLYGILNVDRKASEDEIKNAYRRLCITFHPDKFTDDEAKEAASRKFQAIQTAYDVLSDMNRRYMYDLYGFDGVNGSWDVGPKLKTKEEIREEFEKRAKIKKEMDIQNLVRSRGEVSIGVDVSSYFVPELAESSRGLLDLFKLPEITRASVIHSWESQLSSKTRGIIQGVATVSNGIGGANATLSCNHVISTNMFIDGNLSIGSTPSAIIKLTRNFGADVTTNVTTTITSLYRPPVMQLYAGRNLSSTSMGYVLYQPQPITLNFWEAEEDEKASYTLGYVKRYSKSRWDYTVTAGVQQSSIALTYIRSLGQQLRARISTHLSTGNGITTSFGGDKRINQTTRMGMNVEYSQTRGVTLRLWFMKLGQKFSMPILMTPQPDVKVAVFGFLAPLLMGYGVDYMVFRPWRKRARLNKIKEMREERAEVLQRRKREAEEAVELMRDGVIRKQDAEEKKQGLIILEAVYGILPESDLVQARTLSTKGIKKMASSLSERLQSVISNAGNVGDKNELQPGFIDVTLAVQNFVQNSQLYISGGYSKSNLLGFWDPCLGEKKRLRVTYQFQGRVHVIEVGDKEAIAAPLRGNILEFRHPKTIL